MENEKVMQESKAQEALNTLFSGKRMLFVLILFACTFITQVISAITVGANMDAIVSMLHMILGGDAAGDEIVALFDTVGGIVNIVNYVMLIPVALYVLFALFAYLGAKDKNNQKLALGATFFRVYNMIYAIYFIAIMVATLVIGVVLGVILQKAGYSVAMPIIIVVIALAVLSFFMSFYMKAATMARGMADTAKTGKNLLYVFKFVTVLYWIAGILSIVGAFGSTGIAIVSSILLGLSYVFVAMIFGDYKKSVGLPTSNDMRDVSYLKKYADKK